MSNPFSTINNPFGQGGWKSDWHAFTAGPTSSLPISSNVEHGDFQPLQSSYGTLPLSTSSGVVLTRIDNQYSAFRFVSRDSPANIAILASNMSTAYHVQSGALTTKIKNHMNRQLATLHWHKESLPDIERNGGRQQICSWMKRVQGTK